MTGATGTYLITGIVPGTWTVREVLQANWFCSFPNPCSYTETFTSNDVRTGNDFGNFRQGTKSGYKFEDEDADGLYEPAGGDLRLDGWTIRVFKDTTGTGSSIPTA